MPTNAPQARAAILNAALICGVLILIIFSAILKLSFSFRNDQALFLLYASEMDRGASLYSTIWDIKQPMIFVFYLAAGKLLGFTEYAVHIVELIWNIALFLVLYFFIRPHLANRWIASLAPFCLLIYYTYASASELTQVEALIALPFALSASLAIRAADASGMAALLAFLSGLLAGVASAFKIPFALIGFSIYAFVLFRCWRGGMSAATLLTRLFLPWLFGAAVLWLLLLFYFWQTGSISEFLWTTFVFPLQSVTDLEQGPLSRLLLGGAQILVTLAPWFCLLAGFLLPKRAEERVPLAPLLLIWIGVAALVIGVQRFSWWPYHWWQLVAPLFLLCLLGLDRIVSALIEHPWLSGRQKWVLPLLLLAPFTVVLNQLGQNAYNVANAGAPGAFNETAFRLEVDRNYDDVLAATAAFPGDCSRERIYVFGTPAIYLRLDCPYLYKFAGQNLAYISAAQRSELAEKLRAAPPKWIFVAPGSADWINRREPALRALLEAGYRPAVTGDWGAWYARTAGGT